MPKSLIFIFLLSFSLTYSRAESSKTVPDTDFLEKVSITPAMLTYHRDSVQFTVEGEIPIVSVLIPRNPSLYLELRSSNLKLNLGELELMKDLSVYRYKESFKLPYESWMEGGVLELRLFYGRKQGEQPNQIKIIARGVVTTPLMVKVGQIVPDEPIPQVGLFIPTGLLDRDLSKSASFTFSFPIGKSDFEDSRKNKEAIALLRKFLTENPSVVSFKITGIQSPEPGEGRNSLLGRKRAEALYSYFSKLELVRSDSLMEITSRWNDWFDFRLLLRDYSAISTQKKDELYKVLLNGEPYETQREQLSKISGFSTLSKNLYPSLRVAKVEVKAKPVQGLSQEEDIRLKKALSSDGLNSDLGIMDWALAAETAPRLEDKEIIYSKMTEIFRSSLAYNNLAVVKMRESQRTLNQALKEELWDKAITLLNQAARIEPSAYILHNLGQVEILKGEYWEAYKKLSDASVMSKRKEFLRINESLRGALDIIRGDYKLATLRFNYDYSEPKDLFNKGLAYMLAKDYASATLYFEESIQADRNYGYGFYGLAWIGAASNQNQVALEQLGKAIQSSEIIYQKALIDPVFEEIRNFPEFFELFKKTSK